eukprot:1139354-Pelagomonas_calceolata.AAC.3
MIPVCHFIQEIMVYIPGQVMQTVIYVRDVEICLACRGGPGRCAQGCEEREYVLVVLYVKELRRQREHDKELKCKSHATPLLRITSVRDDAWRCEF